MGRKGSSEQRASRGAILKAELLRDISIQKWQTNQAYLLKSSTNAKTFVLLCVWISVEEREMFCDILSRLKVTQLWEWKEKSKQQTGGADSLIKQNNKMYLAYMTTESWECLRIFEETKFPGLD